MKRLLLLLVVLMLAWPALAQDTRKTYEKVDKLHRAAIEDARKKKYDQALKKFREALETQDKSTIVLLYNMAFTYQLSGNKKKAIETYAEAVHRKEDFHPARLNMAKLQCETGDYANGVKNADIYLKDNGNKKTKDWLPTCRKKLAALLAKKPKPKKKEKKPEPKKEEKKPEKKESKPPEHYIIEAGYEFIYPMRWDRDTKKTEAHAQASSGYLKYPQRFYFDFEPSPQLRFRGHAGVPYSGLVHAPFLKTEQQFEFTLRPANFFFGAGVLFTHADLTKDTVRALRGSDDGEFMTNATSNVSDFKWGPIIGSKSDTSEYVMYIYPRYLFRDKESGSGTAIDRVLMGVEYRSIPGKKGKGLPIGLAFGARVDEIYITEYADDNTVSAGHFFGTYDAFFDIEFGNIAPKAGSKVSFTFGGGYTARFYFQDIGRSNPFQYFNGQGYAGLDVRSEIGKVKFTGYRSNSHIIRAFSRQLLFYHVLLKQTVEVEISHASEKANGIYLSFTAAGKF